MRRSVHDREILRLARSAVWAAIHVLMAARLLTMARRFTGRRWAVVGAGG